MYKHKLVDFGFFFFEGRLFVKLGHFSMLFLQTECCFHVHFRPIWEGGQYEGDETKRQDALRLAMELGADYIDVELEVSKLLNCAMTY